MKSAILKGKACNDVNEVEIEFGRTQASMSFSISGSIARKLCLRDDDLVEVTIKKLGV